MSKKQAPRVIACSFATKINKFIL